MTHDMVEPSELRPGLTIALSTIGARARTVVLPPQTDGIEVLVLLQDPPDEALPYAGRSDLRIVPVKEPGLVASRNRALAETKTEFLLIADDDVTLDMQAVQRLWYYLENRSELAVVTGRRVGKQLARKGAPLKLTNIGRTASVEIMMRLSAIRDRNISFDPRFGIGGLYPVGEEFVFMADILKAGLCGAFVPEPIGDHPGEGSGGNWSDLSTQRARGAALRRVFGPLAPFYAVGFALRHWRHFPSRAALLALFAPTLRSLPK